MKILLALLLFSTSLSACVTYNPSNGTYTVDQSGSLIPFEGNRK